MSGDLPAAQALSIFAPSRPELIFAGSNWGSHSWQGNSSMTSFPYEYSILH